MGKLNDHVVSVVGDWKLVKRQGKMSKAKKKKKAHFYKETRKDNSCHSHNIIGDTNRLISGFNTNTWRHTGTVPKEHSAWQSLVGIHHFSFAATDSCAAHTDTHIHTPQKIGLNGLQF